MKECPKVQRLIEMLENGLMLRGAYEPTPFTDAIRAENKAIAAELSALLADVTMLAAKVPPPVRKLREVHVPPVKIHGTPCAYRWANGQIEYRPLTLTDGWGKAQSVPVSHAKQILALEDDPFEPVETVEDVLRVLASEGNWEKRGNMVPALATRLRAAVAAEGVGDE